MSVKPISIPSFDGGLNLTDTIKNNQFVKLSNFYYNKDGQVETRRGYTTFADNLANPITSYFFFQNDGTLARTAVCNSGTKFYELNAGGTAWVEKKSGLSEFETVTGKTTWRTRWDYAVYKNIIYMGNGVNAYASWDGTTYAEYGAQPKCRYISYLGDRIFGAGDDGNPTTLYYTAAAAADAQTINSNLVVIGGDEFGQINGMTELGQVILCVKNEKIYSVNVTSNVALPIDAQSGGYCNRSIRGVGNAMVYFTDKGIDSLKQRDQVTGTTALESTSMSQEINSLLDDVEEFQYNSGAGFYGRSTNNYYFTYDSNNDNIPDSTVVYSGLTKGWSTYTYPTIYDYGRYVNSAQEHKYLFASGGQMYEMETGMTDNGVDIEYELESRPYDFEEPGTYKTFDYIDLIGYKNVGSTIDVTVKVDGDSISIGQITDANINITSNVKTLGLSILGEDTLGSSTQSEGIEVYQYTVRIPCYGSGSNIAFNMKSTGGVWILEKARISVEKEVIEVFTYGNIL